MTAQVRDPMPTIRKHAKYHYLKLRKQGFSVELDDVIGDFGVVYTKAMKAYEKTNPNGAAFETYLIEAFNNRANKIRREITEGSTWRYHPQYTVEAETEHINDCGYDIENRIIARDILRKTHARLDGVSAGVFETLCLPLPKVGYPEFIAKKHGRPIRKVGRIINHIREVYARIIM